MKLVNTRLLLETMMIFNPHQYRYHTTYFHTSSRKSLNSLGIFWHKLGISLERRPVGLFLLFFYPSPFAIEGEM